jgi:hypothetical protein
MAITADLLLILLIHPALTRHGSGVGHCPRSMEVVALLKNLRYQHGPLIHARRANELVKVLVTQDIRLYAKCER